MAAYENTLIVFGVLALLFFSALADGDYNYSYIGATGPDHWGELPSCHACADGTSQSPINIVTASATLNPNLGPLNTNYSAQITAALIDKGNSIAVLFDSGLGTLTINCKIHTAVQMHWHSPAEHTIDGIRHPLELHVVHEAPDGSTAVVAVLFKYGNSDHLLAEMEMQLHELNFDDHKQIPLACFNTSPLQYYADKYYTYKGSLTTPPCNEAITWIIVAQVREVAEDQVRALKIPLRRDCTNNARPLQALNHRKVEKYQKFRRLI